MGIVTLKPLAGVLRDDTIQELHLVEGQAASRKACFTANAGEFEERIRLPQPAPLRLGDAGAHVQHRVCKRNGNHDDRSRCHREVIVVCRGGCVWMMLEAGGMDNTYLVGYAFLNAGQTAIL